LLGLQSYDFNSLKNDFYTALFVNFKIDKFTGGKDYLNNYKPCDIV